MSKILVTGAAGFIGFFLCKQLLAQGEEVIGLDNLNDYYDVILKQARLGQLTDKDNFLFYQLDLADRQGMAQLFADIKPDRVLHMAAQAGVRYSLTNPHAYVDCNLVGLYEYLRGLSVFGSKTFSICLF
jgi:UDP-glucuronate 4-epimerase